MQFIIRKSKVLGFGVRIMKMEMTSCKGYSHRGQIDDKVGSGGGHRCLGN